MSLIPQNFHKKISCGFTLVESLVAISIIMVALTVTFSVAQGGLASTIAVKDRVAAFFLAQEALEAVRNVKDSNLLAQYDTGSADSPYWLEGLIASASCPISSSIKVDYSAELPARFIPCGSSCEPLRDSNGLLNHSPSGVVSRFTRTITIQEICAVGSGQKEAKVTVQVAWPGNTLTVSDNITNWFSL